VGAFGLDEMLADLRRLVEAESPSTDPEALRACAEVVDDLCERLLGTAPEHEGPHLVWRRPGDHDRPVLLLGHYDTVWPLGTLAGFPFEVAEGIARGPGVYDMKAGVVQALHGLASTTAPAVLVLTADEELGSPASRLLIEREAKAARAVLVLEPSGPGGAVKIARKGVAHWRMEIEGRAAHAGLEPERGVNALDELANQIKAIHALADSEAGTSVTVTRAGGGSAPNVVAESAWCVVDARMWTNAEGERLEREMEALPPILPGAKVRVTGGVNRGPMERAAAETLYERLRGLGYDLPAIAVGGGSDGNFTATLGIPTLDGLGAVGDGAHARREQVVLGEMPRRAEMVARLLDDLAAGG